VSQGTPPEGRLTLPLPSPFIEVQLTVKDVRCCRRAVRMPMALPVDP